jgi:hypothetical protein
MKTPKKIVMDINRTFTIISPVDPYRADCSLSQACPVSLIAINPIFGAFKGQDDSALGDRTASIGLSDFP